MKYLLDTHSFLWYINDDKRLPQKDKDAISIIENQIFVSIASIWEIAIKINIRKLFLIFDCDFLFSQIDSNHFQLLPILRKHLNFYTNLPLHHRDPFDRILIAQAISEGMTIISRDKNFSDYDAKVLW